MAFHLYQGRRPVLLRVMRSTCSVKPDLMFALFVWPCAVSRAGVTPIQSGSRYKRKEREAEEEEEEGEGEAEIEREREGRRKGVTGGEERIKSDARGTEE